MLVNVGSHLVNTENVSHVSTGVQAQPPGKPWVKDAVRIHFLGDTQPLTLFGDEAVAAVASLASKDKADSVKPATPTPAPAASPTK